MEEIRLHQMNDVKLVGRVTRDPDIKYTARGEAFLKLTLAMNRNYKDRDGNWQEETTFVPIALWRTAAQRCFENVRRGSPIYIEGRLRSHFWETEEKIKRSILEVEVRRIQFLTRSKNISVNSEVQELEKSSSVLEESQLLCQP